MVNLYEMQVVIAARDDNHSQQLRSAINRLGCKYNFVPEPALLPSMLVHGQPEVVFIAESFMQSEEIDSIDQLKSLSNSAGFAVILIADLTGEFFGGIDEMIALPINFAEVTSKLALAIRSKNYHLRLTGSFQDREKELELLRREVNLAERILVGVEKSHVDYPPGVTCHSIPKLHVSGDVVVAWDSPSGDRYIMVGDVTGHSLSSAVAVMVVRSIFMDIVVQRKVSLAKLVTELNNRLYEVLPHEMFFAAAFIKVDYYHEKLEVLNAAMPDIVFLNFATKQVRTLPSVSMPLGIMPMVQEDIMASVEVLAESERVYLFSDGFTDCYEAIERDLGSTHFSSIVDKCKVVDQVFDCLLDDFSQVMAEEIADDVTVVEVAIPSVRETFMI